MKTDLYIGPLIERSGRFSYQTFSSTDGFRSSFRYRRVEEARYDRKAMIAEARSVPHSRVHVCETVVEFEQAVAAARAETTNADCGQSREP